MRVLVVASSLLYRSLTVALKEGGWVRVLCSRFEFTYQYILLQCYISSITTTQHARQFH